MSSSSSKTTDQSQWTAARIEKLKKSDPNFWSTDRGQALVENFLTMSIGKSPDDWKNIEDEIESAKIPKEFLVQKIISHADSLLTHIKKFNTLEDVKSQMRREESFIFPSLVQNYLTRFPNEIFKGNDQLKESVVLGLIKRFSPIYFVIKDGELIESVVESMTQPLSFQNTLVEALRSEIKYHLKGESTESTKRLQVIHERVQYIDHLIRVVSRKKQVRYPQQSQYKTFKQKRDQLVEKYQKLSPTNPEFMENGLINTELLAYFLNEKLSTDLKFWTTPLGKELMEMLMIRPSKDYVPNEEKFKEIGKLVDKFFTRKYLYKFISNQNKWLIDQLKTCETLEDARALLKSNMSVILPTLVNSALYERKLKEQKDDKLYETLLLVMFIMDKNFKESSSSRQLIKLMTKKPSFHQLLEKQLTASKKKKIFYSTDEDRLLQLLRAKQGKGQQPQSTKTTTKTRSSIKPRLSQQTSWFHWLTKLLGW